MIVLDTNVVSELIRPEPDPNVTDWVDVQAATDLELTAITAAELRAGVRVLPMGRRRQRLYELVEAVLEEQFDGVALPFDAECSVPYSEIYARRRKVGLPMSTADAQIAAICTTYSATLATRNTNDFASIGLELINPWNV